MEQISNQKNQNYFVNKCLVKLKGFREAFNFCKVVDEQLKIFKLGFNQRYIYIELLMEGEFKFFKQGRVVNIN